MNRLELFTEVLHVDVPGITPYIVLTHKYSGDADSMKSIFTKMGTKKIYTIENYTTECQSVVREKHEEIIEFLTEVLEDIKFRVIHMGDPREERQRHYKFIIKYMKETSDLKKDEDYKNKNSEESGKKKGPCFLF